MVSKTYQMNGGSPEDFPVAVDEGGLIKLGDPMYVWV